MKWIFLKSRIKHSIEAVIHVLIHLIVVLENKWQNKKSSVMFPTWSNSCPPLSYLEQYPKDMRVFLSWPGGHATIFSFSY